ncbi:hypothetical protein [Agrobacterium vitis]|uniref:hypothetical protein n=1 Tax=Agrobacterium vitis TaxID=373 RepID=UPI0018D263F4|nr:hypothetical protein [Agrobacterium vitis]
MTKIQSKNAFLYDLAGDDGELKTALREAMELGSAADEDASAFATAGQGALAVTAIQSDDLVTTAQDGLMVAADKVKLDGVATGATANATDAALRDRSSHTGEQAMATITGLIAALAAKATPADISAAIAALVNSSPAALDTLNELATALGNDPNFATTMSTALGNRLRVDTAAQGLTDTQKANGRTNMGLGSAALSAASDFAAVNAVVPKTWVCRNVLQHGAYNDGTNAAATSTAFQAAYNAASEGDTIVVPPGSYDFTLGVSGTKRVNWDVYGTLLLTGFNWADILLGPVNLYGPKTFRNGAIPSLGRWFSSLGLGYASTESVNYNTFEAFDDIKVFPGRVSNVSVVTRQRSGATGIRENLRGSIYVEAPSGNAPGEGAHYVGIQAGAFATSADNGTTSSSPSLSQGALFAGSSFAQLKSGAINWRNVTSWEFNVTMDANTSAWYRSGIQIAGGGPGKGTVHDYAIAISNLADGAFWDVGVHFGSENGSAPLTENSTGIRFDVDHLLHGIDFGTANVHGAYMKGTSFSIAPGGTKFNKLTLQPGVGTVIVPAANGDLIIETTNNNAVTFRLRGTDGVVRSGTVALS